MDAYSVMHGDWNWLVDAYGRGGHCWAGDGPIRAVYSSYFYRNVPFVVYWNFAWPGWPTLRLRPDWIRPKLWIDVEHDEGGPIFKTQKLLAGRALVADAFGKSRGCITTEPGPGAYAHRDGYNVLYGDWSARWYGDPQQRYIWWPGRDQMTGADAPAAQRWGGDSNVINDYWLTTFDTSDGRFGREGHIVTLGGPIMQWHLLDVNAGVDVTPEDDPSADWGYALGWGAFRQPPR